MVIVVFIYSSIQHTCSMRFFRCVKLSFESARKVPPIVTDSGITLNAPFPRKFATVTTCEDMLYNSNTGLLPQKKNGPSIEKFLCALRVSKHLYSNSFKVQHLSHCALILFSSFITLTVVLNCQWIQKHDIFLTQRNTEEFLSLGNKPFVISKNQLIVTYRKLVMFMCRSPE